MDRLTENGAAVRPDPEEDARTILLHEISWSAVFGGVALALVSHLLLNMLAIGVGIGTLNPTTNADTTQALESFSFGMALWWAIAGIIAAAVGGYAAGRLSGRPETSTAAWHGLTSWAFTTVALFYIVTTAVGGMIGGAFSALGSVAQGVTSAAAPMVRSVSPFEGIEQQLRANTGDANAQRDAAIAAVRTLLFGSSSEQPTARERAVDALAKLQSIPPEQARAQVASYEQQYRQAVEQARQTTLRTADSATRTVSWAMLAGVIALLLGAAAAWWAGKEAAVSPTITDVARRLRTRPMA